MRKFNKLVAVLFIIAMVIGYVSSKTSTGIATGAEQKPAEDLSNRQVQVFVTP